MLHYVSTFSIKYLSMNADTFMFPRIIMLAYLFTFLTLAFMLTDASYWTTMLSTNIKTNIQFLDSRIRCKLVANLNIYQYSGVLFLYFFSLV